MCSPPLIISWPTWVAWSPYQRPRDAQPLMIVGGAAPCSVSEARNWQPECQQGATSNVKLIVLSWFFSSLRSDCRHLCTLFRTIGCEQISSHVQDLLNSTTSGCLNFCDKPSHQLNNSPLRPFYSTEPRAGHFSGDSRNGETLRPWCHHRIVRFRA